MKTLLSIIVLSISLFTNIAYAHGPGRQLQEKSIQINAPVDKVWALVKNFSDIANWHANVSTSPATNGNDVKSVRTLTLKNGTSITEELKTYDAQQMSYSYKINDISFTKKITFAGNELEVPDFPVKSFGASFSVTASGTNTVVKWEAKFLRAYTGNIDPKTNEPKEMNDEIANAVVAEFLDSGLLELKQMAEKTITSTASHGGD
jgi:Polyketide cyclase / dehydrase and lipid transport